MLTRAQIETSPIRRTTMPARKPATQTPQWGVRPHSIGGWLAHLGISNKSFNKMQRACARAAKAKGRK